MKSAAAPKKLAQAASDELESESLTVAAVARRLGVAPATLRTWDRRYGLGPSEHNAGSHRRYSSLDSARLTVMRRLVIAGMSPAEACTRALNFSGEFTVNQVCSSILNKADVVELLHKAALAYDRELFESRIRKEFEQHGVEPVWQNVICPLLTLVGDEWERSGSGIEVEHLVTEVLQRVLSGYVSDLSKPVNPRPVLLACVGEEIHSLAIHALAAALAEKKIHTLFLGARTPQVALNEIVKKSAPPAIFLWAQLSKNGDPSFVTGIPVKRPAPRIIIGGPGWDMDDEVMAKYPKNLVVSQGLAHAMEEIALACGA